MYSNVFMAPTARLVGIRRVVCSKRWTEYDPHRYLRLNRAAMRAAHLVVANGETVRRSLLTVEGVPSRKTAVLPNALEEDAFTFVRPEEIAPHVAERLEAMRARGVVLWSMTARLVTVKQHRLAIAAIASVLLEGVKVGLIIVGDGPLRSELQSQARHLGIEDAIVFTGQLSALPNPAFLGDGVIMSSSAEGMPNSVTEGMAAGRPIVATDVGSAREIVEASGAGEVVASGDVAALSFAILQLSRDADRRRRCGARAADYARQMHHVDGVCKRLLALYAL
jgi:glycosyltransferase involved in cell wall biosynthesis